MLRGPGEKTLSIYQKEGSHREWPVWVSKWKTGANWIYGQVPLSSISQLQVRPTISVSVNSSFKKAAKLSQQTPAPCSVIGTLSNRRRRPDDGNRKRDIFFETSLRMYNTL